MFPLGHPSKAPAEKRWSPAPAKRLRGLRGCYFTYVLTFLGYYFAMSVFGSVLSVYLTGLGLSAGEMSFVLSASSLFCFFIGPLAGYLSDKTRNPRLINISLVLAAGLFALAFSQCRQVWLLFLFNGLVLSFINCASPIFEQVAGASRFRYGALRVWGTLGYAAGAQWAGLLLGENLASLLFPLTFFASCLGAFGFWATGYRGGEEAPKKGEASSPEAKKPGLWVLLKNPQFFLFLVLVFLAAGCSSVNMNYAPLLLTTMGLSTRDAGTVLFFATLTEFPLILFSHRFMDRFSSKSILAAGFLSFLFQFLLYGFSRTAFLSAAVLILLQAVTSTLFMMVRLKAVRNLIGPEFTATGLSLAGSMHALAAIVVQNLGGFLMDATSIYTVYFFLAGLSLLGLFLTAFLRIGNRERVFSASNAGSL